MQDLKVYWSRLSNMKLRGALDSLQDKVALQGYLVKWKCWAITDHVELNRSKCQSLPLG